MGRVFSFKEMKLLLPIKPKFINQGFGETANLAWYQSHGINFKGHNGIDFAASHGQRMYASHDGWAFWEVDGAQGMGVVICSDEVVDHDGVTSNYKTVYWHMVDPVKEPQYVSPIYGNVTVKVKAGDFIGYADSTGLSTGDHLHYGFKWGTLNEPPAQFINMYPDNGYNGASDPTPYLSDQFAEDVNKFPYDLKYGMTDPRVMTLQLVLHVKQTGYFGWLTLAAVMNYQHTYGLPVTGYVGTLTRGRMNLIS